MTDAEVAQAEERYGLTFPPDYRLFLQTLHTTDPERVRYVDGTIHADVGRPFHDWQGDRSPIDLGDGVVAGRPALVDRGR